MAEDRPHLRGPGVSAAAGQGAQQGQAHPGGRVLFPKVNGDLTRAHLPTGKPARLNRSRVLVVFCPGSADHLDHIEQGQLRRDASVTEDLDPVSLAACNTSGWHPINPEIELAAFPPSPSLYSGSIFFFCAPPQRVSLDEVMKKASREEKKL